jgi:hypothetical protein
LKQQNEELREEIRALKNKRKFQEEEDVSKMTQRSTITTNGETAEGADGS